MDTSELRQMNYDELVMLIKNAETLLEPKKKEKERDEIKGNIYALVITYLKKDGDMAELMSGMPSMESEENKPNAQIEELGDVELVDKEDFKIGREKENFKIEEVLEKGHVNHILQEGNVSEGTETFPDPETGRVINPRGISPCLTTGESCLVDVKELECGTAETSTDDVVETVKVDKKRTGRKGTPILQFTSDGDCIKEWESAAVAESSLKMGHQTIGKALRGNHKAAGYLWYRKDDPDVVAEEA